MSANAIETLRLAVASWQRESLNEAQALRMGDALAAVEALLEAAKPYAEVYEWWESPDVRDRPEPRISRPQAAALAAAVRRVTGEDA